VLIIEFSVKNQRLSRYTAGVVASNSYGYLKFKFNFYTNDWAKVSIKMANFSYKGRNYPVLIDENNMCTVPQEVIKTGTFSVSVFGGGITTNTVNIPVESSNISYEDDESISMKYYNEIINKLTAQIDGYNETKADNIILNEEDNTIQLSANGVPIGDIIDRDAEGLSSGTVFVPEIDERKILTWTVKTTSDDLTPPPPTDLNPNDEWLPTENEVESEYIWEPMQ
jgi:hypothetical protein